MKVKAYIDGRKPDKAGRMPVMVSVNYKSQRFFLATGMTTGEKFDGDEFPRSQSNAAKKTKRLRKLLMDVEAFVIDHGELSAQDMKAALKRELLTDVTQQESETLLSGYIYKFAETKKDSTRTIYEITARKVEAYDRRATLDIDSDWLEAFRKDCLKNGMRINGAGKELRNIRAVFNWARRKGYTTNYPFLDYHIVEEETLPNNFSAEDLRRLRDYDCEDWQRKYVDFFFLSFFLAGINPGDLLLLREKDVKNGHVSFVRRKTDKQGSVKIRHITLPLIKEAQDIIKRYKSNEGFLVGFMDGRKDYHSFMKKCNEALKKIGTKELIPDKVGKLRKVEYHPIFPELTLYTARYSFGSIAANDLDISERAIAMCLGHSWSKNVTSRYLANDQNKIDRTVRRVVDYVMYGKD